MIVRHNPYLKTEDVVFNYPRGPVVLHGVSLSLSPGVFTAIVGLNGSGKTTLGKLLAGLLRPSAGKVEIGGEDSRQLTLADIGGRVGYMFQNPDRQLFALSVREELTFPLRLRNQLDDLVERQVDELLDRFHLRHLENSLPFRLSRGEKQRLVLAALMLQQPKYLLLDEPTSSLDRERKADLSRLLFQLKGQGIGMAIITHDPFLKEQADRIITLEEGKVVADVCR